MNIHRPGHTPEASESMCFYLPGLANKNSRYPVKSEFQIDNDMFLSVPMWRAVLDCCPSWKENQVSLVLPLMVRAGERRLETGPDFGIRQIILV